jgi:hypothetical protein
MPARTRTLQTPSRLASRARRLFDMVPASIAAMLLRRVIGPLPSGPPGHAPAALVPAGQRPARRNSAAGQRLSSTRRPAAPARPLTRRPRDQQSPRRRPLAGRVFVGRDGTEDTAPSTFLATLRRRPGLAVRTAAGHVTACECPPICAVRVALRSMPQRLIWSSGSLPSTANQSSPREAPSLRVCRKVFEKIRGKCRIGAGPFVARVSVPLTRGGGPDHRR